LSEEIEGQSRPL